MTTEILQKSIALILSLSLLSTTAFSQIHVDVDAAAGGDGTSWASAYNNLETALSNAVAGNELWVAEGTYFIAGNADDSFEIPSGVAVYGGFGGWETNLNSRNWASNTTSLNGNFTTETIVYFDDSNSSTILNGFTIENGYAHGSGSSGRSGAAIFMNVSGSGMTCSPQIFNCTILNNESEKPGGGVYIDGAYSGTAAPYFENCIFESNSSTTGDGGAIYIAGNDGGTANAQFSECTFKLNLSEGSGGAIFAHGGDGDASSSFTKCNFENNTADGNGGAVYSKGTANHKFVNSRFYANKGFAAGGIYSNASGDLNVVPSIINCTFYLNEATGVNPDTGAPSGTGGGIYNNGTNTIIKNCIVWGNIAPYGTHVVKNVNCSPTISYCIVDAEDCDELDNGSGSAVICGTGIQYDTDPHFMDASNGNLRIADNSPAINMGEDLATNETEDLDKNDRFISTIDIGAYENLNAPLPIELFYFDAMAKRDKVLLEWATLSEEENELFVIEKSADGRAFKEIEFIEGAGNSNSTLHYKTVDLSPFDGNNYYRLKTISFQGLVEYSDIRIVKFSNQSISIYPNPVRDDLQISFNESVSEDAIFEIFSIYGESLYKGNLNVNDQSATISLNSINSLVNGNYILRLYLSGNQQMHQRFQVIR